MQAISESARRRFIGGGAVALIGASLLLAPSMASADVEDAPILLARGQSSNFRNLNGDILTIKSDTKEVGERIIAAETADGQPAIITIQTAPVGSLDSMTMDEMVPAEGMGFVEEDPGTLVEVLPSEQLSLDQADWEEVSALAVTRSTATFRWDASLVPFEGSLDGEALGTSVDGRITVENLEPAHTYTVELRGQIAGPDGEAASSVKTITVATLGGTPKRSARTYQAYTTAFMHRTFIPPASVDGSMCNWGNPNYTFKGDNRSYKTPTAAGPNETPNYRTMMFANINWDNAAPYTVITAKGVGLSVTQNNGVTAHSSYADTSGMKFEEIQSGGAYAQVRFNHTASNPHCSILNANYGGAIRYNEIVRFYRSGTVEVVGYRQQAPAHEGYARFSDASGAETWTTVFQLGNSGFHCLIAELCSTQTLNYSKSY